MNYPSLRTSAPRLFHHPAEPATAPRYSSQAHQRHTGYHQSRLPRESSHLLDDTLTEVAGMARNNGSEMDAYAGSY
jgi:hypothetical protein